MEPIRLSKEARAEFEARLLSGQTRGRAHLLRVILSMCGGKAECWPGNDTLGQHVGIKARAVKYILRDLEASGAIRCVEDMSLSSRRRIVLLGHPGTAECLRASKWARRCPNVVQVDDRGGGKARVGAVVQRAACESIIENLKGTPARPASSGTPPSVREPESEIPDDRPDPQYADVFGRFFGNVKP